MELENITELNLEPKILEMEKLTSIWRCRNLTLIGKITIIKTLMISKIIHILLSLPKPSEESFIRIENAFKKILWNEKPPKFKISTLENLTADGGLHFPDIRKIDTVIKHHGLRESIKLMEAGHQLQLLMVLIKSMTMVIYLYKKRQVYPIFSGGM